MYFTFQQRQQEMRNLNWNMDKIETIQTFENDI